MANTKFVLPIKVVEGRITLDMLTEEARQELIEEAGGGGGGYTIAKAKTTITASMLPQVTTRAIGTLNE